MKILVTGSNGQVGHSLVKLLSQMDFDFKALSRNELDISDSEAVDDIIKNYLPDIVINAAAYTAVDKAETEMELAYKINAEGAKNLAVASSRYGASIFHISTDYVFAGSKVDCYCEDDETNPQCVYGASKLAGEKNVALANQRHIIIRTAWVFGEHGSNFVKTMLRLGREKDSLGIVADQFGGPTYAGDIAAALIKICIACNEQEKVNWGIYHYSGAPHVSWFEFASAIFNEAKSQGVFVAPKLELKKIETAQFPTPAKRPSNSKLECSKIQQEFDISPSDWMSALKNIQAYS